MSENKRAFSKLIQHFSKHPIIFIISIISSVIGGLIVAMILSAVFWQAVLAVVLRVWHILAYPVPVPVGLLALLILCAVFVIAWVARRLISPGWKRHYKQDCFDAMVWRWKYKGTDISALEPFCPKDDMALVWAGGDDNGGWDRPRKSRYYCETCRNQFGPLSENDWAVKEIARRQIECKIRTGEWKTGVKKQVDAPKSRGHGLPTKRAKERLWGAQIYQLIKRAADIGRSAKRAVEWRDFVVETLEDLLFDATEEKSTFLERTRSMEDGKNVASAVESGIQYLERIRVKDGGELK